MAMSRRLLDARVWFRLACRARLWLRRHRTRRQLDDLDARLLADIGLCESARRQEKAKWFWQA